MSSYRKVSASQPSNFAEFVRAVLAARRGAAGPCPREQPAIRPKETRPPKRSAGLQAGWSRRLARVNETRTACALFRRAQLGSAAACINPSVQMGKGVSRSIFWNKMLQGRVILFLQRAGWHGERPPSPRPAYGSQQPWACCRPTNQGSSESAVVCCSCLIRGTDALSFLKFCPASRLALMVQILAAGFIGSSHPVAMTAMLLLP